MTMILAAACYDFAILVGDRMVSRVVPKIQGFRYDGEHDSRFNKLIIVAFQDAIAALGFSGPAYLDGIPTDQWIATAITGVDMRAGTFRSYRPRYHPRSIGVAFHRIRSQLAQLKHGNQVQLLMTGHRIVKNNNWPMLVFQKPGFVRFNIRPFGREDLRMSWIGAAPNLASYNREVAQLIATGALNANSMTSLLMRLVRQEADRNNLVGNDLHTVVMDRWNEKVVCRFEPGDNRQPEHSKEWLRLWGPGAAFEAGEPLPTPWIIGGRMIVPPTEIYGQREMTAMLGQIPVVIEGPGSGSKGLLMMSSAGRKPSPR